MPIAYIGREHLGIAVFGAFFDDVRRRTTGILRVFMLVNKTTAAKMRGTCCTSLESVPRYLRCFDGLFNAAKFLTFAIRRIRRRKILSVNLRSETVKRDNVVTYDNFREIPSCSV